MTERPRRIPRPGPFPVVAGALAVFLVVFSLLAFQVRAQRPTALAAAPAQPASVRRVLERRVVVTKVVVLVRRESDDLPPAPAVTQVVRSSAPAAVAVPAPAIPAPAPARAPLTTRTS
jgi:hypothetical protein